MLACRSANLRDELCKGMIVTVWMRRYTLRRPDRAHCQDGVRAQVQRARQRSEGGWGHRHRCHRFVVEATIKKPEDALASWPHMGDLKTRRPIHKLKIKYPKGALTLKLEL